MEWNTLLSIVLGVLMAADASQDDAAAQKAAANPKSATPASAGKRLTVYVPVFKNQTAQRGVESELTEAVIREIESKTPYKVVSDRDSAESELLGTIATITKHLLNSNQVVEADKCEMVVTVQVAWRDVHTGEMPLRPRKPGPMPGMETAQDNPLPLGDPMSMPPDRALFLAGSVEFCLQHYREADHYFTHVTELHPDSPLCDKAIELAMLSKHMATGDADYESNKAAEARMVIDKALHKYPKGEQHTDTDTTGSVSAPPYVTFQAKSNYTPEFTGSICHSDSAKAVNCLAVQIVSMMEKPR
jgi:Lipopolysaccharide-assembly